MNQNSLHPAMLKRKEALLAGKKCLFLAAVRTGRSSMDEFADEKKAEAARLQYCQLCHTVCQETSIWVRRSCATRRSHWVRVQNLTISCRPIAPCSKPGRPTSNYTPFYRLNTARSLALYNTVLYFKVHTYQRRSTLHFFLKKKKVGWPWPPQPLWLLRPCKAFAIFK